MIVRLTSEALRWFEGQNISFHNRFGQRLLQGDLIRFQHGLEIDPYVGIHGGNTICEIGFLSYTNTDVPEDLVIGRYCSLGPSLHFPNYRHPIEHVSSSIFTHDRETDLVARAVRDFQPSYNQFHPNPQPGPVIIGHDVWVGQGASIMGGLTIGHGCVVAANSVITRSVPPYAVVGGNPAHILRMRFASQEIIGRLLMSEWWNYQFTDFVDLDASDPAKFLDGFERRKADLAPFAPHRVRLNDVLAFCELAC
jgi:virginiamycin A acetyltransferase